MDSKSPGGDQGRQGKKILVSPWQKAGPGAWRKGKAYRKGKRSGDANNS